MAEALKARETALHLIAGIDQAAGVEAAGVGSAGAAY